jgi:glycosyltransferase involved in cell wall biosynthesis
VTESANPIRLAFCITELDPGGAERALIELVTRLDRRTVEPRVFCLAEAGPLAVDLARADIPVECLGVRRKWDLAVIARLARRLKRFRPALLQTYLFHANIAGRIAGRLAGVPRIVSGIRVAEHRRRWYLHLDRLTAGLVDRHVCVSRGVADFSIDRGGLRPDAVTVIPNGVDARRYAEAAPADLTPWGIPPGSRTVLAVGRLDPQKAPFVLLEAAVGLLRDFDDLHVLYVGDGPLASELQARIAESEWHGRIHLAGRRTDVPELMRAAYCLAHPSLWEGMSNAVLEAMAAGLPVVASRVEGSDELLDDGRTGLLVEPNSAAALQSALARLLSDPQQAAALGQAAQRKVEREFTWSATVAQYEELYADLIGRPIRSGGGMPDQRGTRAPR